MRKRDLFLAGLLFMAVPAFAQDEPTFTAQDAKVIFTQDFEADWDTWQSTPVDTIYQLEYYNIASGGNKTFSNAWSDATLKESNLIVRKDSVSDGHEGGIILYNGVMLTDDAGDISSGKYDHDTYSIIDDASQERKDAFAQWGEDGGQKLFRFTSADRVGTDYSSSSTNLYTDAYRRNLFVRLNKGDIEPETSYRLTFYVKAKETNAKFSPRLHAAIFRGYFHSEKPFTMGLQSDDANYKYNTQIEYTKEDFTNDWEKVTYMTYYLNDSIADYFMLSNGYWWSDNWVWKAEDNGTGKDLVYIKQPDKFFVRLSFQSDSTDFQLDNLSLTKSWIGGCEYSGDKMRVDFGYKTNLSDIVAANKKLTNLPAVGVECEVPDDQKDELGYDWRIQVWGLKDDDSWEEVYMRSAEYHDDGYMYLFTEFYDEEHSYQFDDYKKVLVTFHNPTDIPELTLKYTGTGKDVANLFPNALDTAWIKKGKIVPDFYNEIATPNPFVFTGVHSLADLPPVMQKAPYEEGSFGLEPVKSFTFKFSRDILIDDAGAASEKAIGYVNGAVWTPSFNAETNELTFTCPDDSWKTMKGDVEVKLIQLYGKGTDMGENVVMHFHFGGFDRVPDILNIKTDWKSQVTGTNRPYPEGVYVHSGASGEEFSRGTGADSPGKCGLYNMNGEGLYNCGFYLSSRANSTSGNLYTIQTLPAGNYTIDFRGLGWGSGSRKLVLKIYPVPGDIDAGGFALLEGVEDKVEIGRITKWDANITSGGDWKDGYTDVHWSFSVPADGDYVLEFYTDGSSDYKGVIFSNYNIKAVGDLSSAYTVPLNEVLDAANARLTLADATPDLYTGAIYDALTQKIEYYKVGGAFDALKETEPTVWEAAKNDVVNATSAMKLRMDTVDKFVSTRNNVVSKLSANKDAYEGLEAYKALSDVNDVAKVYPVTEKSGDDIYAFNKQMDDAVAALDNRLAINKAYEDAVKAAQTLVTDAEKPNYNEFTALESCLDSYAGFDAIKEQDAAITDATAALKAASSAYQSKIVGASVLPTRVKALYALANELGSDIVKNGALTERLDATDFDDDELAEIYKTAITIALYDKADANDPAVDSLVVTPFIKNYHLYATINGPVVDNTSLELPSARNNAACSGKNHPESQIMHVAHQWGQDALDKKIWVLMYDTAYVDVFPGWSVQSYVTSSHSMVTPDLATNSYANLSKGLSIFDGKLTMDWNSRAELKTELVGLPVGIYDLSANFEALDASSSVVTTFSATTADSSYVVKYTADGAQLAHIDSIEVADGNMSIYLDLRSNDGGSRVDDFGLVFYPLEGFDYAGAIDELESHLDELMTVVDANKAVKAGVEYYTIGGIKLDAPKAGQILLRKTTQNGKVVIDKVLMK